METIDQMQQRHNREMAKLHREHQIMELLPLGVLIQKPDLVHHYALYESVGTVVYRADSASAALGILNYFDRVPVRTCRHRGSMIVAPHFYSPADATDHRIWAPIYAHMDPYGDTITSWAQLRNGWIIKVQVELVLRPDKYSPRRHLLGTYKRLTFHGGEVRAVADIKQFEHDHMLQWWYDPQGPGQPYTFFWNTEERARKALLELES